MYRQLTAVLAAALMFPPLVSGQTLAPGTRVRFALPDEGTRTGTVVALTPDTLDVRVAGRAELARLPLDQLTRLDVSRGMQRQPLRRAGIGFLVGGTFGAVGGAIAGSECHQNSESWCYTAGGGAFIGGIFYGSVGGVLGLAAGAIPSEKWERVQHDPPRISLLTPSGNRRHGVGLRVAF